MKPISVSVTAAGNSNWVPTNWRATDFQLGLGVTVVGTVNYTVQHTFDSPYERVGGFSIARVATTATVAMTSHGLAVGDSVTVDNADAPFDGTYDVATVADADTFTYTVANSGATASNINAKMVKMRVFPHSILAAQTARADGNYAFPVSTVRVKNNSGTGTTTLTLIQSHKYS